MIALWYGDGDELKLAPFQDGLSHIRVQPPAAPEPVLPLHLSPRERRAAARSGAGPGRRAARRVSRWRPVPRFSRMPEPITYIGHLLSDGRLDVYLYLPAGRDVERRHLRDVERWLLLNGRA